MQFIRAFEYRLDTGSVKINNPGYEIPDVVTVTKPPSTKRLKPKDLTAYNSLTALGPYQRTTTTYGTVTYNSSYGYFSPYCFVDTQPFNYGLTTTAESFSLDPVFLDIRTKIKSNSESLAGYIGEYKESVKTFQTIVNFMYDSFMSVIRIKNPHVRRRFLKKWFYGSPFTWKDVPSQWLNAHFAIAPLLGSLSHGLLALQGYNKAPPHARIQSSMKDSKTGELNVTTYGPNKLQYSTEIDAKGVFYVTFKVNTRGDASEYTLGNIFEMAWEGIPFSFVIDWMLNVGDILYALDALSGVSSAYGTVSVKKKHTQVHPGVYVMGGGSIYGSLVDYSSHAQSNKIVHESYQRFTYQTVPPVYIPSVSAGGLSALKNAAALLLVLHKGKPPR